jgi:hypothetical protein
MEQTSEVAPANWYGWQTLLADAGTLTLAIVAASSANAPLGVVSYGSYIFSPPIIHWVHGKTGIGFASLGMRVVGPVVTTLIGYAIDASSSRTSELQGAAGAALGLLVGYVATVVVDAAVFAYDAPAPRAQSSARGRPFVVVPTLGASADRASIGLGGTF